MTKLNNYIKKEILPFVKSTVIPMDNRIQMKAGQQHIVIWKMAQKRKEQVLANVQAKPEAITDANLKSKIPYGILIQNDQNQWRILAVDNATKAKQQVKSVEIIPEGQYTFVRTQQGFIRLKPIAGDANHRALSDHADKVRYAGMLYFKKDANGEAILDYWENASGGYQPEANRSALAGLPQASFRPLSEDKLIPSPIAKNQPAATQLPTAFELTKSIEAESNLPQPRVATNRNTFFNFTSSTLRAPIVDIDTAELTKTLTAVNTPALQR